MNRAANHCHVRRVRPVRVFAASAICVGLALAPSLSNAAEPAPNERPQLLERAQRERAAGDHKRAVADALRAGAIRMTASVRRFVAEEQLALGDVGEAFMSAEKCTREAALEPPSPNHDSVLLGCRTLLQETSSRVARVTVRVAQPRPDGLSLTVAGKPVTDVDGVASIALTPGHIVIEARAPGYVAFRREAEGAAGAAVTIDIALVREAHEPPPLLARAPENEPPPVGTHASHGALGIVIGSIGLAAAAAGVTTWFVASSKYDDLKSDCAKGACGDSAGRKTSIQTLGTAANIGMWGGLGLAGAGVVIFAFDTKRVANDEPTPKPVPNADRAGIELRVSPFGASFEGRF